MAALPGQPVRTLGLLGLGKPLPVNHTSITQHFSDRPLADIALRYGGRQLARDGAMAIGPPGAGKTTWERRVAARRVLWLLRDLDPEASVDADTLAVWTRRAPLAKRDGATLRWPEHSPKFPLSPRR